jgi:rfaE bifunctional protein nucleotidyltransferase chain/domain
MSKLYTRPDLLAQRVRWKAEGKKVVFTNGCYDVIHPGHIRLLESARSLVDILVLGLNTDSSVQRMKGPDRPFFDQNSRASLAAQLEAVDAVVLFEESTPQELVAALLPDVLVKGADWSHFVAGREEVEAAGGEVRLVPLEPGFSSTNIATVAIERYRAETETPALQP